MHWEFLQEALANAQGPTETANDPSLPSVTTTLTDGSQLPSYFLQKSQQQRRFQGSLISLACPNYSEAGHKDKTHQPASRELSLAEKMTDFITHFPLITESMYVCMQKHTNHQNERTFEK